jgi:hypothetical protein
MQTDIPLGISRYDDPDVLPDSSGVAAHDPRTDPAPMNEPRKCGSMNGAKGRGGRPCGNPAGKKTDHLGFGQCWLHGGNTPNGKAAAERMRLEAEQAALEATARRYCVPVDMDPRDGLLEEVARAAGWLRYWDQRVNDLEPEELAGVLKKGRQYGSNSQGHVNVTTWEAGNHVVVLTWERARRDFVKVCKDAAQAGVEERRVKLAEEQGALLAEVVRAVVDGLGRSLDEPEVEQVVRGAMSQAMAGGRHLRAV